MPTYRHGRRVEAVDRDGASMSLDRAPLLSSRSSPSSSVVSSTKPSQQSTDPRGQNALPFSRVHDVPVDLHGQDPVSPSSSRLTRTPNYLHGDGMLLNVRSHSRARASTCTQDSRTTHHDDSHAYTASGNRRPLRRSRPLQEAPAGTNGSRPLPSSSHDHHAYPGPSDTTNPQHPHKSPPKSPTPPPPPPPRKDSAAAKFLRRTLDIRKTTSVSVKSEPATSYVKSSGSNVFVEKGEFDDGNLYAGTSRDRYKYSVKVWSKGVGRKRKMEGVRDMGREVGQMVGRVLEVGRRGWRRVKGVGKWSGSGLEDEKALLRKS